MQLSNVIYRNTAVPAILDFPLPVWHDNIVLGPVVTRDPENIGFAVETALLSLTIQKLFLFPV
jgi:hypothetical protein